MSAPRYPTRVGSRRWIATLALLTATTALSVDTSLPAQPTFAREFTVSSEVAQLTLSVFLLGFAIAQLFVGYLSDAWGRRRVLLGGLVVYCLAGIACAASPSIELLVAFRFVHGVGAASAPVVARAMVRDTQPAQQAARLLSTMLAALAIAPMIAPVFGGVLLDWFGWRAIFGALVVAGLAMLVVAHATLVDTLPAERRVRGSPRGLVASFARFFRTPGTRLPTLVACASFGGQFAYIADSPFVLMQGYDVPADQFGFYFASTALALMLGSLFGGRLLRAGRSPGSMLVVGTMLLLTGGALVAIGTRTSAHITGFLAPMLVYFFGVGITSPCATALAMDPVPQIAGTASSALGFLTMVTGALSGYETTKIGGSSPRTFAIVVVVMAAAAAALATTAAVLRRRPRASRRGAALSGEREQP
jgi:DHA1 family bicyclomycin/chloramphenicol resistance-like MFS transporter